MLTLVLSFPLACQSGKIKFLEFWTKDPVNSVCVSQFCLPLIKNPLRPYQWSKDKKHTHCKVFGSNEIKWQCLVFYGAWLYSLPFQSCCYFYFFFFLLCLAVEFFTGSQGHPKEKLCPQWRHKVLKRFCGLRPREESVITHTLEYKLWSILRFYSIIVIFLKKLSYSKLRINCQISSMCRGLCSI